jgi:hypothetical protein
MTHITASLTTAAASCQICISRWRALTLTGSDLCRTPLRASYRYLNANLLRRHGAATRRGLNQVQLEPNSHSTKVIAEVTLSARLARPKTIALNRRGRVARTPYRRALDREPGSARACRSSAQRAAIAAGSDANVPRMLGPLTIQRPAVHGRYCSVAERRLR